MEFFFKIFYHKNSYDLNIAILLTLSVSFGNKSIAFYNYHVSGNGGRFLRGNKIQGVFYG